MTTNSHVKGLVKKANLGLILNQIKADLLDQQKQNSKKFQNIKDSECIKAVVMKYSGFTTRAFIDVLSILSTKHETIEHFQSDPTSSIFSTSEFATNTPEITAINSKILKTQEINSALISADQWKISFSVNLDLHKTVSKTDFIR